MDDRVRVAAEAIGLTYEDALNNFEVLADHDLVYVWDSSRGGLSALVASDCTKLVAGSAVRFEDHLDAFLTGRRN